MSRESDVRIEKARKAFRRQMILTLVELVRRSPAGLDAGEIRSLLGLDPRSFLSAFAGHPQLRREKTRGRFVYFCSDEAASLTHCSGCGSELRPQKTRRNPAGQKPGKSGYMKILLNGKATLEAVFSDIDIESFRQAFREARDAPEKIPAKLKPSSPCQTSPKNLSTCSEGR